jgi:SPP1 gp7 family putative phage head morphogenesis protein
MQPLQRTINRIEKAVYKKGINVALYNAEHSKTYILFQQDLQRALFAEIKTVADVETIDGFLLLTKGANPSLELAIGVAIGIKLLKDNIDLGAFLVWAGTQGGQSAMDKANIEGTFLLKNQELINYFDDYSKLIINSVDDYTKRWIAGKIQQGKDQMLSPKEIAQTLIDEGKAISKIRAERIVLTETAKAMTLVENEANKKYGIEEIVWRTSLDERTCPICLPLEGEKITIGKLFSVGTEGPPAHVSCRCFTESIIPQSWEAPSYIWTGE